MRTLTRLDNQGYTEMKIEGLTCKILCNRSGAELKQKTPLHSGSSNINSLIHQLVVVVVHLINTHTLMNTRIYSTFAVSTQSRSLFIQRSQRAQYKRPRSSTQTQKKKSVTLLQSLCCFREIKKEKNATIIIAMSSSSALDHQREALVIA